MKWTFPLAFAEIVSGDGSKVYRERIDLSDTPSFGSRTLKLQPQLAGRKWVRFEGLGHRRQRRLHAAGVVGMNGPARND